MIGLGCVAGMIGVSLFYKATNLAEFQAIQLWRIEWLLGATAAFLAGILLKKSADRDRD
jgi:cytosine/uracil/thiamine/allantoin permease